MLRKIIPKLVEQFIELVFLSVIPLAFLIGAAIGGYVGYSESISGILTTIFTSGGGGILGATIAIYLLKFFSRDDTPPACPK